MRSKAVLICRYFECLIFHNKYLLIATVKFLKSKTSLFSMRLLVIWTNKIVYLEDSGSKSSSYSSGKTKIKEKRP